MTDKDKNKDGYKENISFFFDNDVDIDNRIIEIKGEIDESELSKVLKAITIFSKNPDKSVDIYINSEGGAIYDGFGIYDIIRSCPCTVNTYCLGQSMSSGTIIFLAGDKRYCYENSVFMFHSVLSGSTGAVKASEFQIDNNELQSIYKRMCQIYAKHTDLTYRQWYAKIRNNDVYIWPEKAKEIGIVDTIL